MRREWDGGGFVFRRVDYQGANHVGIAFKAYRGSHGIRPLALSAEQRAPQRSKDKRVDFVVTTLGSSRKSAVVRRLWLSCIDVRNGLRDDQLRFIRRRGLLLGSGQGHFGLLTLGRLGRHLHLESLALCALLLLLFVFLLAILFFLFNRLDVNVKKDRLRCKTISRQYEILIFFQPFAVTRL